MVRMILMKDDEDKEEEDPLGALDDDERENY
jgi:hypothetical protein